MNLKVSLFAMKHSHDFYFCVYNVSTQWIHVSIQYMYQMSHVLKENDQLPICLQYNLKSYWPIPPFITCKCNQQQHFCLQHRFYFHDKKQANRNIIVFSNIKFFYYFLHFCRVLSRPMTNMFYNHWSVWFSKFSLEFILIRMNGQSRYLFCVSFGKVPQFS